jgi:predicted dehydrogenase
MFAIIGNGSHVKKNILPVLKRMSLVPKYIVVNNIESTVSSDQYNYICCYNDVLRDKNVTHIYIATPIATHFALAKKALMCGKNVLCEKPLTSSLSEAKELFEISQSNNCFLQEVVMYIHHNQFSCIKSFIESDTHGRLLCIKAKFKIPHLEDTNIRYSKSHGGGALLDVGFYPISSMQLLIDDFEYKSGVLTSYEGYDVDLNGCAIFCNGSVYGVAEWSIGACYKNEISLEFEDATVHFERAFSKPFDLKTKVNTTYSNGKVEVKYIAESDHFERLFKAFLSRKKHFVEDSQKTISRIQIFEDLLIE